MTIPHTKYGHSPSTHFRYLTCLLDRGHIIAPTFLKNVKKKIYVQEASEKEIVAIHRRDLESILINYITIIILP